MVERVNWGQDRRWLAIGTVHAFPMNPFGSKVDLNLEGRVKEGAECTR